MSTLERKLWGLLPVTAFVAASGILLLILSGGIKDSHPLPTVMDTLDVPIVSLVLELADTPVKRAKGLAGRTELPMNHAMLFVYEEEKIQCMWAKDMKFPVVAVFIDGKGKAVNASKMTPGTTTPHCSSKPVRYVLEANEKWVLEHGGHPKFYAVPTNPAL